MSKMQLNGKRYRFFILAVCIIITIVVVIGIRRNSHNFNADPSTGNSFDSVQLNQARLQAHLPACVDDFSHPQRTIPLRWPDIPTTCLATGAKTSFGQALDGKKTLVNLWAYWCEPCRAELPIIQEFARKHADKVRVLLIHIDPDDIEGLHLLAQLHISLPCITDYHKKIRLILHAPPVVPVSALIGADGQIEHLYSQSFDSLQELEQTVHV